MVEVVGRGVARSEPCLWAQQQSCRSGGRREMKAEGLLMGEARPHPGLEQREVKDRWAHQCQDQQMAGCPQGPTTNSFISTTPTSQHCSGSSPPGISPTPILLASSCPHPLLCLRLSQVSGGCSELRHIWPLQKDPHLSGYGG